MSRQLAWAVILAAAILAAGASFAQQKKPYNELMKDIAATYASVKKNLDASAAPAAAADAAKLQALFKETGAFYMTRLNLSLPAKVQKRLSGKLEHDVNRFDSQRVSKIDRTDGLKIIREDGSWILMRPSGTEPVVRVYCEAPSQRELARLAAAARKYVLNP